jgi:hypothetical protein
LTGCGPFSGEVVETTTGLNLRECPESSKKCDIKETLPEDTELEVLKERGSWIRVEAPSGRLGWVHQNYIAAANGGWFGGVCFIAMFGGVFVATTLGELFTIDDPDPGKGPLISGAICGMVVAPLALSRNSSLMALLTLILGVLASTFAGDGRYAGRRGLFNAGGFILASFFVIVSGTVFPAGGNPLYLLSGLFMALLEMFGASC